MSCDFNVSKLRQALVLSQKLLKEVEPKLNEWGDLQAEVHLRVEANKKALFLEKCDPIELL